MATYTYSFELKDKELCFHDIIIFKTYNEEIRYKVLTSFLSCISNKPNDYIFTILGIEDKWDFCDEYYNYKSRHSDKLGIFPQCHYFDYKGLTKLVYALLRFCEEQFDQKRKEKSLYKKGDKVLIKKEYDKGCGPGDYPCFFSSYLLHKFGGKTGFISEVLNCSDHNRKLYLEPFCYFLNIDGQRHTIAFSAPMFETESKKIKDEDFFTFIDSDIPNYYQYSYAILDLSIQEYKKRYSHLTLNECFQDCIKKSLSDLFCFNNSILGRDFWLEVVRHGNKFYIPEMYEPKYYSPTSLLKEDSNSNKTLASNPDYDNGLDKSSFKKEFERKELNISIPCSYEEVKLSIKKPKIKF